MGRTPTKAEDTPQLRVAGYCLPASPQSTRLVVVYERVSDEKQDISRQAVQRELAKAAYPDAEIVVIQDDGVSAFKVSIFDRLGGCKLCDLIEADRVAAVFVDAQDRLSRGDELEWVSFRALCEAHDTRLVIDGRELRNDMGGRLEGYLGALVARRESVEKSHRVKGGMLERAKRGKLNGGRAPYGFAWVEDQDAPRSRNGRRPSKLVPVPHEMEIVKRAFTEFAAGKSQKQIARDFIRDGLPARLAEWHQGTISSILRNPVYVGKLRLNGEVYEAEHDAIIDQALWDRVASLREASAHTPGGGRGRPSSGRHLFGRGILRCGECGGAMVPRTIKPRSKTGRAGEWYLCYTRIRDVTACSQTPVPRALVDAGVERHMFDVGVDVEATVANIAQQMEHELAETDALLDQAEREHAQAELKLTRVRGYIEDGKLDPDEWGERSRELLAQREAATANVERLRARRDEVAMQGALRDAESETLRYLAAIREAIVGEIRESGGVEALRSALVRLFDSFTLHRIDSEHLPEHPGLYSDLVLPGGYVVEPHVRAEVVESFTCNGVVPVLRREPLYRAENKDGMGRPFHYDELVARIRAVLRRVAPPEAEQLAAGAIEIDRPTRRVTVAGERVVLPTKEYELLLKLASDPSRVFTKEELLRDVWGFRSHGRTRTLDSHASRLRRRLARPGHPTYVQNVWGVGYCLLGD